MSAWPLAITAGCTAFSGFVALGLAMDRHHEDSYGRGGSPGSRRPWLQTAGAFGLMMSLAACLALYGPAQGWVLWLGMLTAGALAVVGVLSYAPRRAARLAGVSCAVATVAALMGAMALWPPAG